MLNFGAQTFKVINKKKNVFTTMQIIKLVWVDNCTPSYVLSRESNDLGCKLIKRKASGVDVFVYVRTNDSFGSVFKKRFCTVLL